MNPQLRNIEQAFKQISHPIVIITNKQHPLCGQKAKLLYAWWLTDNGYQQATEIGDYLGKSSQLRLLLCPDWRHVSQPEFVEVAGNDVCLYVIN